VSGATKPAPGSGDIASPGSTRTPLSASRISCSEEPTPTVRSRTGAAGPDPDHYQLMIGDVGAWPASVWGKDAMTPIYPLESSETLAPACGTGDIGARPTGDGAPAAAPPFIATPLRREASPPPVRRQTSQGAGVRRGRSAQLPPSPRASSPIQGRRVRAEGPVIVVPPAGARAAAGEPAPGPDRGKASLITHASLLYPHESGIATSRGAPVSAHADLWAAPPEKTDRQVRHEQVAPPPPQLGFPHSGGSCVASARIVVGSIGQANLEVEAAHKDPPESMFGSLPGPGSMGDLDFATQLISAAAKK